MGRKYKGLDYEKITVKLDAKTSEIVRQYGQNTLMQHPEQTRARPSDTIRDAIELLGHYMELADAIETSMWNLLEIAKVFDKIDGPNAFVYAEAIREAAVLLWAFCETQKDAKMNVTVEEEL